MMDDDELFDEFGNYIGPESGPDSSHESDPDKVLDVIDESKDTQSQLNVIKAETSIVLHEDKRHYATAIETYGPDTEVLVQDQDLMAITEPIIKPIVEKKVSVQQSANSDYAFTFMRDISRFPELIRNVAIVGSLHHGKTSLVDILVSESNIVKSSSSYNKLFTDTNFLERKRGISLKSTPLSLILPNLRGKSHLAHLIDCPGHTDFADESCAAMELVDGVVIVVDVIEGVMLHTEKLIEHACRLDLDILVVINKLDRLILELKIPPEDAYYKIKHTIDQLNHELKKYPSKTPKTLDPRRGNVVFASCTSNWMFSLQSFASLYIDFYGNDFGLDNFHDYLWGDIGFSSDTRKFSSLSSASSINSSENKRSFVQFVLEPIYKLYSLVLTKEPHELKPHLAQLGIKLKAKDLLLDVKPLLAKVCQNFFGEACPVLGEAITKHINSSDACETTKLNSSLATSVSDLPDLVVNVTKQYLEPDASEFLAFGRIYKGTLRPGMRVSIVQNTDPSAADQLSEDDLSFATIKNVYFAGAQYRVPLASAEKGNLVLIEGISDCITKSATLFNATSSQISSKIPAFVPIRHYARATIKIAIEPANPTDLPKMLNGMKMLVRAYSLLYTKVEESGEHVVFGTGELYLDSCMHDLRTVFAEININISDPSVSFTETIVDISSLQCFSKTPNNKNKFTMVAEPMEAKLVQRLDSNFYNPDNISDTLMNEFGWDKLAARSVWAFGPEEISANILQNDTLDFEVDPLSLESVKDSIVQGFHWATKEGPLCDEPVRGTRFKLTYAEIANEPFLRASGQIIPTIRRVCYSSFLTASPRLMEPVNFVEIECTSASIELVHKILNRRRGFVLKEAPHPGSVLFTIHAYLPIIDSFGFETDLRVATQGQAFSYQIFDHWEIVPGNPLDKSQAVPVLEAASLPGLARDFMLKNRRRKGLIDDVSLTKYLTKDLVDSIRELNLEHLDDVL